MAWQPQNKEAEKKVNPEQLADKVLNNIIDYDFEVATTGDAQKIADYQTRFVWLVNAAESVCVGSKIISRSDRKVDFEKLSPEEENLLVAARALFSQKVKDSRAKAMNVENLARSLLEEAVESPYDAKLHKKEMECKERMADGKMDDNQVALELARYRFQLMVEAAESKKLVRKEMSF